MKQATLCLLFLLPAVFCRAQVSTNLIVRPQPTAVLSEWANDNSVVTYVVSYTGQGSLPVLIKTELKRTDGTVIASSDLKKVAVHTLQPGNQVFFAKDVFPLEAMIFAGSAKATLDRSGKLPSGSYQLTVQLVSPDNFSPVSEAQTRTFFLAATILPVLVKPFHKEALRLKEAQTAIIFRWTPVTPSQQAPVQYRIQVFEMLDYQQPLQALRGNQPILDEIVRGTAQYIWRPQLSFMGDNAVKQFIWTIQTLDGDGLPLNKTDGNGESRSEPFVFSVTDMPIND